MNRGKILALVAAFAVGAALALGLRAALVAPDTAIPWSVFGSGGASSSSSTSYGLGSTAGQPAIGLSDSGGYRLGAGFWYGAAVPTPTATPSPTPTATVTATPTPLLGVHYTCYFLIGAGAVNAQVTLETQFGTESNVTVGPDKWVCPPALKDGAGDLNASHLECFDVTSNDDPSHEVKLETQFGIMPRLAVGQARELCVPALKTRHPNPLPVGADPPTVPHYKCYEISGHTPNTVVLVEDQFTVLFGGSRPVLVQQATRLCAPAVKTYLLGPEGTLEAPHLVCYKADWTLGTPLFIYLRTQFRDEDNGASGLGLLCAPALKTVLTTPTPTATATAPPWCSGPRPWPVPVGDNDCDGFTDALESYVGTDPARGCPLLVGVDDTWPTDNNLDTVATLADVLAYIGPFNKAVPPAPVRFDINMDTAVTLADVLLFIPFFNKPCAP